MLLLTFRAAADSYAVAARQVVEIVPRIELRAIPHAPAYLLGMFHYRGAIVPVIDLSCLMGAPPCRQNLDTRIVVVEYPVNGQPKALLGLLAERVNDLQKVDDEHKVSGGLALPDAPYLGPIYRVGDILVQRLDVVELLPDHLRQSLFGEAAEGR